MRPGSSYPPYTANCARWPSARCATSALGTPCELATPHEYSGVSEYYMNSSTPNTKLAESPKQPTTVSEEAKNLANRRFAELEAQRAVEGLRNLAAQKRAARSQKSSSLTR